MRQGEDDSLQPLRGILEAMQPRIEISGTPDCLWTYTGGDDHSVSVSPPRICLDNQVTVLYGKLALESETKINETILEKRYTGKCSNANLKLSLIIRLSDSPVVRFRYIVSGQGRLTRPEGKDVLDLAGLEIEGQSATEIRLSDYSSLYHGYMPSEVELLPHDFTNRTLAMGPILTWSNSTSEGNIQTLLAYEHGSQWPDAYLSFQLEEHRVSIIGLKGSYDNNHSLSTPFETVWMQLVSLPGTMHDLRHVYRSFILERFCPHPASRSPKVFYNTWNNQERVHSWQHGQFLTAMNEKQILEEIEAAAAMGIETYVLDVGWFEYTGDWRPSRERFPNGLGPIKAKLDSHKIELGLWFGPTTAALSSTLYKKNEQNRMTWRGEALATREVWETEESAECCLVSSYADDFAEELVRCAKEYGVTYFKWDAIEQYGCDDHRHSHGNESMTPAERADRYAFLQPIYMARIVEKLQEEIPNAIVDFDVTESARCVGLAFLSVGKYFSVNNGPYYQEYDIPNDARSTYTPHIAHRRESMKFGTTYDNINLFFHPGPARGWVCRTGLEYDRWIPSTLFLVHYLPDDAPANNQLLSIASLVLGHGGIWGDIAGVSTAGREKLHYALGLYRKVREASTRVGIYRVGQPGGMIETYDKVDPASGEGLVVLFTGRKLEKFWGGAHDVGILPARGSLITRAESVCKRYKVVCGDESQVEVRFDEQGRAIISLQSTEVSAAIVFFGA